MTATLRARWLEFSDEQAAAYIVLCVSTAPREPATLALVEVVCDAAGLTIISEATAGLIDKLRQDSLDGRPVSDRDMRHVRYAIAAATPAKAESLDLV